MLFFAKVSYSPSSRVGIAMRGELLFSPFSRFVGSVPIKPEPVLRVVALP